MHDVRHELQHVQMQDMVYCCRFSSSNIGDNLMDWGFKLGENYSHSAYINWC